MATIYADTGGYGDEDGTSWANAYASLKAAVDSITATLTEDTTIEWRSSSGAAESDVVDIDFALGTYTLTISGEGMSSSLEIDATKARIVTASQSDRGVIAITGAVDNGTVVLDGVQIDANPTASGSCIAVSSGSTANYEVKNSILGMTLTASASWNNLIQVSGSGTLKISNCVFITDGETADADEQEGIYLSTNAGNAWVYNCTFDGQYDAVRNASSGGAVAVRNCGGLNLVRDMIRGWDNYTVQTNSTSSPTFDSGYALASGDSTWQDQGTDLSGDSDLAITDDALGDSRSGSYDIGADEYVASGTTTLTMADATHSHALDAVALTQANTLSDVGGIDHAHALDAVGLTQANVLDPSDIAHTHSLDALDLIQANVLSDVGDIAHTHSLDAIVLSAAIDLIVDSIAHAHGMDGVVLTQATTLAVDALSHVVTLDGVELTQAHALAVADLLHAHSIDSINFSQASGLVTITFTDGRPAVTFTTSRPSATFTGSIPDITFTGE